MDIKRDCRVSFLIQSAEQQPAHTNKNLPIILAGGGGTESALSGAANAGDGWVFAEIRSALARLPDNRTPTRTDWARLSAEFRTVLDNRIAQMQALREKLDGCIGCGCLSLDNCALYNPDDRSHAAGSGPRYLMGDKPVVK